MGNTDVEGNPDPDPNRPWVPCPKAGCDKREGHTDPCNANE